MGVVNTSLTFASNDVITSVKMNNIIDETVFTSESINGQTLAVVTGKLQVNAGGITSVQMASNSVTNAALAADAVTTAKILDANVTTAKILDANVTTAKILDANVTTPKIADASITAPKLNGVQTGTAPVFGVRAWVNFDGITNADAAATYSRTGVIVTVTATAHGFTVGHKVRLDFTTGGATDGSFVVTSATADTFQVTHTVSGSTTGLVSIKKQSIRASGNVSSVSTLGTGQYAVNFTIPMPNANYARAGYADFAVPGYVAGIVSGNNTTTTTLESCDIFSANSSNATPTNFSVVNAIFVG